MEAESADYGQEILAALHKYKEDQQSPQLSSEAIGYIRHCLAKAQRNAAAMGEEVDMSHHQLFALMVMETDSDVALEFLQAISPGQE